MKAEMFVPFRKSLKNKILIKIINNLHHLKFFNW